MNTRNLEPDVVVTRHEARPKPISDRARLTYGLLAALSPLSLILTLVLAGGHAVAGDATTVPALAIVVGIYQVIGTAMLVAFFGRDMLSQRGFTTTTRVLWSAGFIFAAPIALPFYWLAFLRPDPATRRARRLRHGVSKVVVRRLPRLAPA